MSPKLRSGLTRERILSCPEERARKVVLRLTMYFIKRTREGRFGLVFTVQVAENGTRSNTDEEVVG